MTYQDVLRSPRWRQLKRRRLMVARFRCEKCGRRWEGRDCRQALRFFDLHHCTYDRIGSETLDDVQILCPPCHRQHHGVA